ncbi:hypothetical protein N7452_011224 [Penicillium brevicompactum]|uniref:Protoporphyrinogen oxidase n=1 Tax=Penicillium brevicompactum TaxID=5074 RepID=A0A9W9Q1P3_PENBR|nr:hypothetical protein N7452_011224 [Penicillium brevicompactum]
MRLQCASAIRQRPLVSRLNRIGQSRNYRVAILGGGITGLTSAWQLSRDPRCESVTIFEKSNRLGGWIDSERVPVNGGEVLFEYGPRTLRSAVPTSLPLLYLATNLGLKDELIFTSKKSPAALNRFIYYPDRLVKMPGPSQHQESFIEKITRMIEELQDPVFEGLVSGIFKDIFGPPRHPSEWAKDESVTEFVERRWGSSVAENLVSAVYHGIYAGDIDQLSAQMLMGELRNNEGGVAGVGGFVSGGVLGSMVSRAMSKLKTRKMDDFMALQAIATTPELIEHQARITRFLKESSTFSFKRGVGQLVEALVASLEASPKVKIYKNAEPTTLGRTLHSSSISIECTSLNDSKSSIWANYDHVISTIPPVSLAKIMRPITTDKTRTPVNEAPKIQNPGHTPYLLGKHNYAVTAMVVNLYYSNPNLLPVQGFGYLIPRSIPWTQNPECGLGVIFASQSSTGRTADNAEASQDTVPGTKLTVMMGGHYWDGRQEYPDHDTAVHMARTMLHRHLNITATPAVAKSRLQKNAIPQYTVGHLDRMYDLSKVVRHEFDNRLVLAGNWYNGVGVGDCVNQGIMASTFGIGYRLNAKSAKPSRWRPWESYDYKGWDLRGGVVTAPARLIDSKI